jgi:hypothetical protein
MRGHVASCLGVATFADGFHMKPPGAELGIGRAPVA